MVESVVDGDNVWSMGGTVNVDESNDWSFDMEDLYSTTSSDKI